MNILASHHSEVIIAAFGLATVLILIGCYFLSKGEDYAEDQFDDFDDFCT